jgi:hypothetical protein
LGQGQLLGQIHLFNNHTIFTFTSFIATTDIAAITSTSTHAGLFIVSFVFVRFAIYTQCATLTCCTAR